MKTFTTTFHHTTNYGATLQSYALQQTIQKLGHENVIMEYSNPRSDTGKSKPLSLRMRIVHRYIKFMHCLRKKQCDRLVASFRDFHEEYMNLSKRYVSMDELRNDPPEADCLITGSDQVWNLTSNSALTPAYFLDFGKPDCIRFSYAASIEKLTYTEEQKRYVNERLSQFKGISLREESAKQYIESFTDYKCQRVLDPVFLLTKEEWNTIAAKPRITVPYILCYQVLSNPRMQEVVNKLKKMTGLPIVTINNGPYKLIKSDYALFDVSPEEFLGLYNGAKIVVTTSFHGTAFGIVYNKPTYALIKNVNASRISDTMKLFGLQNNLISASTQIHEPKENSPIVVDTLAKERELSIGYLKDMLSR